MLLEILAEYKNSPEKFSARELEEIQHHKERLEGNKFSLLKSEGKLFSAELNLSPYAAFNITPDTPYDTATSIGTGLEIDLTAGENLYLGFSTDQYLILETGDNLPYRKFHSPLLPDFNMYTYNFSDGGAGFNTNANRSRGDNELSIRMDQLNQFTIDLELATISFGRNALSWGESQFSNNLLSGGAKPYEYFMFDIPFGEKIYFTWMTGFLKDRLSNGSDVEGKKLITSHKVEYQLTEWFMFSIYEAIVYSQKFELAYLNPFSLYYISEVAQGDYDNKLGGVDFVFRFASSVVYFSVFVDDWDFGEAFNPSYFHNEFAVTLGVRNYGVAEGLTISAEYTYLNQWMYTHKKVNNNRNNYTHYSSNMGNVLQPNSHIAYLDLRYDRDIKESYGFSFWFTQHGYGNIFQHAHDSGIDWDIGGNYNPWTGNYNFLDYGIDTIIKETNFDFTIYGEYRIPFYGTKLYAGLSCEYTKNKENIKGDNEWKSYLTLAAKIEAY
jgi:hypothetical protein